MAYDEGLAERIRGALDGRAGVSEKRMFGGIAFLVKGHMAVGIVQDKLMVRVGPDSYQRVLRERHARRMDFTGRPMKGFVYVVADGYETDADLQRWVDLGVGYVTSLPAKPPPGKSGTPKKRMTRPAKTRRRGPRSRSARSGGRRGPDERR